MRNLKKIISILLSAVLVLTLVQQTMLQKVKAEARTTIETEANSNLFVYGGFDDETAITANTGNTRGKWSSEDVNGSESSGSLELPYTTTTDSNTNYNSYIYYTITVLPSTVYTISLTTKFTNGGSLQIVAYSADSSKNVNRELVGRGESAAMTDWTKKSINIKTGDTQTSLKIRLGNMNVVDALKGTESTSTCYIDDLQIRLHEHIEGLTADGVCEAYYWTTEGESAICSGGLTSPLVINGTFPVIHALPDGCSFMGKNSVYGWGLNQADSYQVTFSPDDANGIGDSGSIKIVKPTGKADKTTNLQGSTTTLKADTHYRLTWKVKADTGMKVYPRLLGKADSTCKTDHELAAYAVSCKSGEWVQGEITFTNATAQAVTLYFYFNSGAAEASDCTILMDDIVLTEVPHGEHMDVDHDGICDFTTNWLLNNSGVNSAPYACDVHVAGFAGAQAVLNDEIELRLYVNDGPESTTLKAVVNEEDAEIISGDTGKFISVPLAAKEMADTVTAELYLDGDLVATKEYSVREYANAIINGVYTDTQKAVARAMLNYGAWAQSYFNYNTSDFANSVLEADEKFEAGETDAFKALITGTEDNSNLFGAGDFVLKEGSPTENFNMKDGDTAFANGNFYWGRGDKRNDNSHNWAVETNDELGNVFKVSYGTEDQSNWAIYPFTFEKDTTYIMSYWYKTGDTAVREFYPYIDGSSANASSTVPPSNACVSNKAVTDWTYVSFEYTPAADNNNSIRFMYHLNGEGQTVYLADVRVTKKTGIENYNAVMQNKLDSFVGYTLVLDNTTAVRLYFNEDVSVKVDGTDINVEQKNGKYYAEIANVGAGELDKEYTITVTGSDGNNEMTLSNFSVLSAAAVAVSGSNKESLRNLCIALILYAEAVNAL